MRVNLEGQRFGRITVLGFHGVALRNGKPHYSKWECLCDCGNKFVAAAHNLRAGNTRSCGCLQKEAAKKANWRHGHSTRELVTPAYISWAGMIQIGRAHV